MLKVGLTGGIGSGKSTVSQHFSRLGVPIIDTDQLAREVVTPGSELLARLVEQFGTGIIGQDGSLDRAALRELVFFVPQRLQQLEALLHPAIRKALQLRLPQIDASYVIIVIPLLLEKGWHDEVDRILVVDCSEQAQLERATSRDQCGTELIQRIIAQQVTRKQRLAASDDIIHNTGSFTSLASQVETLHRRYLELATQAR